MKGSGSHPGQRGEGVGWIVAGLVLVLAVAAAILWWRSEALSAWMGMGLRAEQATRAVISRVEKSGSLPNSAGIALENLAHEPAINIYGVEDEKNQDDLLAVVRDSARSERVPKVWVTFFKATVVKDGHGGARFPGGVKRVRTEQVSAE